MTRYHNTDNGPKRCTASVRACPYGEAAHHDTHEAAQAAYEVSMSERYGATSSQKSTSALPQELRTYGKVLTNDTPTGQAWSNFRQLGRSRKTQSGVASKLNNRDSFLARNRVLGTPSEARQLATAYRAAA